MINLVNLIKKGLLSKSLIIRRINKNELNSIKYIKSHIDILRELGMIDVGSLVVDVDPKKLRTFEACAFTPVRDNCPWVDSASLILNNEIEEYEDSPMFDFFNNWSPRNAYEYFGLKNKPKNKDLLKDPIDVPLPWEILSQKGWSRMHRKSLKIENSNYKLFSGKMSGWACSGNISNANAKSHFERLKKIVFSIRDKEYIRSNKSDGDIQVKLLFKDKLTEPIFQVFAGGHRVSAYGAFRPNTMPVRISRSKIHMVKRWESKEWFNVKNNLFTEEEALIVFDRIYKGVPCKGYKIF
tara:strand:- start:370 stop:1257 length:888 start_codon:yes stop_codon:yes gene_type:complete